ncbi:MAG TPA: L,D-transpeptidase [Solirubrobacteraceae bacterium]|nr:L,D-transpeptidase [Solirubrobacteraceae bacterium]
MLAGAVAAGGVAAGVATTGPTAAPRGSALPSAPRSALAIPDPRPLAREPHLTRWAPLRRAVTARADPAPAGASVARLSPRTPEGTPHPLAVIGRRADAAGRIWLRVRLPVLPNGTTGWVPRRAVGAYELVRHRLVVDLRRLRATLLSRGRPVFRAVIGSGQQRWPTPRGEFLVRNRLERYRSARYGPLAFGTSARSATLTDWPAGGFVGIHGTDRPELLPGRVSHGCIRMRNADILRLARLMPVGTPVTIR